MLGFDARAARAAWTVVAVLSALFVLYQVRRVLLVVFAAVLLAYLLAPVLKLLERFSRGRLSRALSLAVVYLVFIGLLVSLGAVLGNRVGEEASALAARFPGWIQTLAAEPEPAESAWWAALRRSLLEALRAKLENIGQEALPLIQKATAGLVSLVGGLIVLVIVPVLSFFLLKDGGELKERLLAVLPAERRALWDNVLHDVDRLLGQFIRALALLALATFLAYGAAFALMGIPYAVLLATVAGVLEFIPVLGPLSAAIGAALVVIVSGHGSLLAVLAFLGIYRLFQDYVLQPHLMSAGLALHPVLVITGALAGEAVAGVPGMFVSVPVLATLRILYVRLLEARTRAGSG